MTLRRYRRRWYIATIGGLSAVSTSRLDAKNLVLAMFIARLESE